MTTRSGKTTIIPYKDAVELAQTKSDKNEEDYLASLTERLLSLAESKVENGTTFGHLPPYTFKTWEFKVERERGRIFSVVHPFAKPTCSQIYSVLPNVNKALKEGGWKISKQAFSWRQFKITSAK